MTYQCYNCFRDYADKTEAATCCVVLSPQGEVVDLECEPIYQNNEVINGFVIVE